MKVCLSREIVWKLKNLNGKTNVSGIVEPIEYMTSSGYKVFIPRERYILVTMDVSDHSNPWKDMEECQKWIDILRSYFRTSYKTLRVNIGSFTNLHAFEVNFEENLILFRAEDYIYKPCWKDWFIMEGDDDASEFVIELLSNVRNSG